VIVTNKTLPLILLCILGCSAQAQNNVHKTYYNNDILISVQSFKNGVLNGISREYYQTGALKHVINYKNDKMDGMYNTYYPNDSLWVNETFSQGNLINRREYSEDGDLVKKEAYYQE